MRFGDVDNLWAIHRGGEGPVACFAGHTDVVPTGPLEKWHSDPFEPVVREGLLYGRGAADMKSGVAAMTTAALEYVAARPAYPGSIAFVITSDEEGRSVDGTRRVVDALRQRGQPVAYCIVGEPSSQQAFGDTVRIGRRGSLSGRLTVQGVAGPRRLPGSRAEPDPCRVACLHRARRAEVGRGRRAFPPDEFPGQQRPVRHGRDQRHSRRAARRIQFALVAGADAGWTQACRGRDPRPPWPAPLDRVARGRDALLHGGRQAQRGRRRRSGARSRAWRRSFRRAAARRTVDSSARSARRSSNSGC